MLLNVFMCSLHFLLVSRSALRTLRYRFYWTCSKEDATVIFRDAALYNMTDAGHVWIVTEQALFSNNTPVGTLGLKLNNDNETEHIRVSSPMTQRVRQEESFRLMSLMNRSRELSLLQNWSPPHLNQDYSNELNGCWSCQLKFKLICRGDLRHLSIRPTASWNYFLFADIIKRE